MDSKKLGPSHKTAVTTLLDLLRKHAALPALPASACFPLITSTFGILGGRGFGKSSLLNHIYHHSRCPESDPCQGTQEPVESTEEWNKLRQCAIVCKPLDCSILPGECEPGMAVLSHLHEQLSEKFKQYSDPCADWPQRLLEELQDIIGLYTRIGPGYNELSLDLSGSPEDYGAYRAKGLQARLGLQERLSNWLEDFFRALKQAKGDKAQQILVVLLDDFDLVPAEALRTQRWIPSLLNELCQPRLACVLAADIHRLEHLSWPGNERTDDDKTGRTLVNKLLPPQNQVVIKHWPVAKRAEFRPHNRPEDNSLWDLAVKRLDKAILNEAVFYFLLPAFPRGLEGFYLALHAEEQAGQPLSTRTKVLHLLAISRNESLLSRRLEMEAMPAWISELRFEASEMMEERWLQLVEQARQRPAYYSKREQDEEASSPLPGLELALKEEIENTQPVQAGPDKPHDPLRHDELYRRPLRDAVEDDRMLWAELLLDMSLAQAPRRRSELLLDWPATHKRLEKAAFHLEFSLEFVRKFILDNYQLERAVFYWLEHDEASFAGYRIGWPPLFAALRGGREVFDPALFETLLTPLPLAGQLPAPYALELLPNRLWALILFSDGLHRCPWTAFSGASVWMVGTYLGLAAAFVRSAYAYALAEAFPDEALVQGFSAAQQRFVAMIRARDPASFLPPEQSFRKEEDVLLCLQALFSDDWAQQLQSTRQALREQAAYSGPAEQPNTAAQPDPVYEKLSLIDAAAAYLQSPVYLSVTRLLKPYWEKIERTQQEKEKQRKPPSQPGHSRRKPQ